MIEIIGLKTYEVSDNDIHSIYELFEEVFHKRRSLKSFKAQFSNTSLGYSFHAIAKDNGKIIGHNVYVPFKYLVKDRSFLACLSLDAMIHPDYRGKGVYRKLLQVCEDLAVKYGCVLRFGFPNDNSYPVQIKGFNYNDVGRLNIYCLPIDIGKIRGRLGFLNPIVKMIARSLILFSKFSKDTRVHTYKYRKDRDDFNSFRYKWFGGYEQYDNNGISFVYKDAEFNGIRATFLLDVCPLNKKNFDFAVREIYKRKKDFIPILIYVGNLPFVPRSMVRIPEKLEPKHFHFVTKILNPYIIPEDSLEINNWELNLSNYDLL